MSGTLKTAVAAKTALTPTFNSSIFRKLWWTTKNLLIIRPQFPNDGFTGYSFAAADPVKATAIAEGWNVTDLQMNDTNRAKVTQTINSGAFDFIIHYDHGGDFAMCGQNNNAFENAIDNNNVDLLKGKAVSTVSCDTAVGLGPLSIVSGAKAYLGYNDLNWVYYAWKNQFAAAANAANIELLQGQTFQQAYNTAYPVFTQMYQQILNAGDSLAASALLHNRNCFTLLGDPNAVAIGRHSIFELKLATVQVAKPIP